MSTRAKSRRRKPKRKTPVQLEQCAAKNKAKRVSRMTHDLMEQMLTDVLSYLEDEPESIPYSQMAKLADVADDIVDVLNKKMTNSSDEETE